MPHKDKEVRRKYLQEYYRKNYERLNKQYAEWGKTPKGHKQQTIRNWKHHGINCDEEWDEVFDWWLNAKTCNICDKEFVISTDKCLDHDHILEGYNVRGILCQKCNNYQNEL